MPSVILLPGGIGNHGNEWTQVGGTSKFDAVDPGDPIVHDEATTRVHTGGPNTERQSFTFEALSAKVPDAETVAEVRFFVRLRSVDALTQNRIVYRSANSTTIFTDLFGLALLGRNDPFADFSTALPPGDGGDWTVAKADGAQIQLLRDSDPTPGGQIDDTSVWLVVTYAEAITTVLAPDEAARRRLLSLHLPKERYSLDLGPRGELVGLEDFHLVDPFAPESTGEGFGEEEWERRLLRPERISIHPGTQAVKIEALDPRKDLTTFFLQNISDVPGSDMGVLRYDNANVETFARASKAWIERPDGRVHEVPAGRQKWNHKGLLLERGSTNYARNSSFVDGLTGYTQINSANVTLLSRNYLFADENVAGQSVRLEGAASPGGVQRTTVHSFGAGNVVTASGDYRDLAGGRTIFDVQNTTTGNWLRFSDGAWVGARPANVLPSNSGGLGAEERRQQTFTMEGTASTLLWRFQQQSTSAGSDTELAHIQIEEDIPYATSRMVTTDAADFTRASDDLEVDNPLGNEAIPFDGSQFTIQAAIRPLFASTVTLPALTSRLLYVVNAPGEPDDSFVNYTEDGSPGDNHLVLHLAAGGGVKPAFAIDDEIKIVQRRSSSFGEHDLDPDKDQLMVSVNGGAWLEGAQVASIAMAPQTDAALFLGGGTTGAGLDCYIVWFKVSPNVPPKEEAKDFP